MKSAFSQAAASLLLIGTQASSKSSASKVNRRNRGLQYNTDPFQKFENKDCRTIGGEKGEDGGEFDLFFHVTREECRQKCLDAPFECFGYEYADHSPSGGGYCEVWNVPIGKHKGEDVEGFDCYVADPTLVEEDDEEPSFGNAPSAKGLRTADFDEEELDTWLPDDLREDDRDIDDEKTDAPISTKGLRTGVFDEEEDDEDDFRAELVFQKFEDKGCRTSEGEKGSDGHEFDEYHHLSKNECKQLCISAGDACFGWEYAASGKCEVWYAPIDSVELAHVPDLDCYVKF